MSELDFSKPENLQTRECWHSTRWTLGGDSNSGTNWNLVPKPARVTGWQNVYDNFELGRAVYQTPKLAALAAKREGCESELLGQIYIDEEIQP